MSALAAKGREELRFESLEKSCWEVMYCFMIAQWFNHKGKGLCFTFSLNGALLFLAIVIQQSTVSAQSLPVTIIGTTATQAVISYTAPDTNPCSVQASINPGFSPLVADVDPTIFTGSQMDNRPIDAAGDTLSNGLTRTFVIGQRTSQMATAGPYAGERHYSRALQAATAYYVQVTCGAANNPLVGSVTLTTATIALGNTYPDPWLVDPQHPGEQPWPETIGGSSPESFIDPMTGLYLRRASPRGNGYIGAQQASFSSAYNAGQSPCDNSGPWINPCDAIGTSGYASVGQSTNWLVIRGPITPFGYGQYSYQDPYATSLDQLQVTLAASASGCTGTDCQIDVCLSLNDGASCASTLRTAVLGTASAAQVTFGNAINTTSYAGIDPWLLDPNPQWQTAGYSFLPTPRINVQEMSAHRGTGSISGNTLTWTGGDVFSLYWITGGNAHIRLSTASGVDACVAPPSGGAESAEYAISSFTDGLNIVLSPTPSVQAQTEVSWCVQPFAVMVRRHTASAGMVFVGAASMMYLESPSPTYPDAATDSAIFNTPIAGGYFAYYGGLQWANSATGQVNYYGQPLMPLPTPSNPYYKINCPYGQSAAFDNTQTVPTWYCVSVLPPASGASGPPTIIVARGQFGMVSGTTVTPGVPPAPEQPYSDGYGTYGNVPCTTSGSGVFGQTSVCSQNGNPSQGAFVWTVLTPTGADITTQMQTFDPSFNAGIYGDCFDGDAEKGTFFIYCYSSVGQNSPGWVLAFQPGDGNPNHAGAPGGPSIVGAVNTYNTPNGSVAWGQTAMTGQSLHSVSGTGETGWIEIGMDPYAPVTTTQSQVPATSPPCGGGLSGECIQLQMELYTADGVTGYEPYISPQPPFLGTPGELRTTQVGDTACITSTPGTCGWWLGQAEILTLVAKGPNGLWTFERNGYGAQLALTGTQSTLYWESIASAIPPASNDTSPFLDVFWDPIAGCPGGAPDPHGNCLNQDTNASAGHGFWGMGGSAVDVDLLWSNNNYAAAYETMTGSVPSLLAMPFANMTPGEVSGVNYTTAGPPFHGAAVDSSFDDLQSHPGPQGANNPFNAQGYTPAFDVRPFLANSTAPGFSQVTGQLYVSNPQTVQDPDDFTPIGGAAIDRKIIPTAASCGSHPLLDVSGPNASLSGLPVDSYKYAVVRSPGEVESGSSIGQIYVNCPGVIPLSAPGIAGCAGNGITGGSVLGVGNDICVSNMSSVAQRVVEFGLGQTDEYGAYTRALISAVGRLRMTTGFANVRLLPDNSAVLFRADWSNYDGSSMWMATMPPLPSPLTDNINRQHFIPVQIPLSPPPTLKVAAAAIEFGYAEYNMNCTTRNDPCVATQHLTTIPATDPFAYASEKPKPTPCTSASGCTITIPAVPGHVLFMRVVYWNTKGAVAAVSSFRAGAVH